MIRMLRIALTGCAAVALLAAGDPAGQSFSQKQAHTVVSQLPLRFEANQGQFDSAVRFAARTSLYTIALTEHGAALRFAGAPAVTMSLPGSAALPMIEPLDLQTVRTDYMVGARENWHTGVANYSRVRYRSVYPGIDMVFYGKESRLEYDFVLQPGADPDAIRLQFEGAGALAITVDGDVSIETPGGAILQKKPVVYQQDARGVRRQVAANYIRENGNQVAIELGAYDRSRALVIDPTLTYSTLIGGSGTDLVAGMEYKNGLLYIAGSTQSGTLLSTDVPYTGSTDAFVEVINMTSKPDPTLKYFTYLGGTNADNAYGMDVDSLGFIYVVGQTASTDFPVAGTAVQSTGAASTFDAFLSKLDPNQAGNGHSLVYSTYLGGTIGDEVARGVAVDNKGIAYVLGTTKSADFPVTDNAYAASLYGPSDCFLSQIDTVNGVLLYSTFFGSELDDDARGIVLAPNGLVYYAATTLGTQFPVAGNSIYNPFPIGDYDLVIGAFDLTKSGVDSLVYGTYFGGSASEEVRGIALDPKGRLLITGYTLSPDFPTTTQAVQPFNHGNGDAFVTLLDLSQPSFGFVVYSTFLGGSDGDVGYGVAADAGGYLYVTGYTLSGDFPTTDNAPQANWGGGVNLFITRINPKVAGLAGIDYSTYIGIDSIIVGCCLTLGPDGSLYVGGYAEGYLPLIGNPIQSNYGGGYSDGFVLVLSPAPGSTGSAAPTINERKPETLRIAPGKGTLINGRSQGIIKQ